MRVGAYINFTNDGTRVCCEACNIPKILDRDSTNWNDLVTVIDSKNKLGSKHKLCVIYCVIYWDKVTRNNGGY